jgi:hypothetical protein
MPGDIRDVQANALRKFLYTSCTVTPTVWIEAFLPAAVLAIFSVLTPDPKEAIRIAGGGKSWLKQLKVAFNDALADEPAESYKGLRFLFDFAEGVDKAVWWLFLAGVAADFAIEWSTLAYRMSGCTTSEREVTQELRYAFGGVAGDGTYQAAFVWREVTPDTGHLTGALVTIPPQGGVALAVSINLHNIATGLPLGFDMRWRDVATGETISETQLSTLDAAAGNSAISLDMQVQGGETGRTLVFEVRTSHALVAAPTRGRITVYGGTLFGVRHRTIKNPGTVG